MIINFNYQKLEATIKQCQRGWLHIKYLNTEVITSIIGNIKCSVYSTEIDPRRFCGSHVAQNQTWYENITSFFSVCVCAHECIIALMGKW